MWAKYLAVGNFLLIFYITDLICVMVEEFNRWFCDIVVELQEHVLYSCGANV